MHNDGVLGRGCGPIPTLASTRKRACIKEIATAEWPLSVKMSVNRTRKGYPRGILTNLLKLAGKLLTQHCRTGSPFRNQKGIVMKQRFILFRRGEVFYYEDTVTGQQISLRTRDEGEATT